MKDKLIFKQSGKDPLYKTWHSSSNALFLYIHSGAGSVVTKEHNYPLENNTLLLITPGTYHYTIPDIPAEYVRSKLILSSSSYTAIQNMLTSLGEGSIPFDKAVSYAKLPPETGNVINDLFAEAAVSQNTTLFLSIALRLIFFLKQYATEDFSTTGFMSKALRYINENISQALDLDTICAAIHISKYHFCRQCKQQLGITVMQYILNTRIVLAKEALEQTDASVTTICQLCGFSSISYFCQAFKAQTGLTPLQYRKHHRLFSAAH